MKYATIECKCEHAFQDSRYGKGRRVFTTKSNGTKVCTVCGKEQGGGQVDGKKVKK